MIQEARKSEVEKTKEGFDSAAILEARRKTWEGVELIRSRIEVGMYEEDALPLAYEALKELGAEKHWHRPHVRFGVNTLKAFAEPSVPRVRLGEDDLFFIDLGPVFAGYEGDAGATYATGTNSDKARCIVDGRRIHTEMRARWEEHAESGEALYDFGAKLAESLGWKLNLFEANGHRLSEFPHALYFRGGISELEFRPSPYLWVLEVQIRHPTLPYGAFYEDLLV